MKVPPGLCQCGCGTQTRLAPYNWAERGWVRGQPLRYVPGHTSLGAHVTRIPRITADRYEVRDLGYSTPCHIWLGAVSGRYGQIRIRKRLRQAHRVYYEQIKGPVPEGLVLDHLCKHTTCVNPDHLEPVTQQENVQRGKSHVS